MTYDPEKHHRRSIRLQEYDYTKAGCYFVTLCTQNREHLFGEIVAGKMQLNEIGGIVEQCWNEIPRHFPHMELDEWVIMPNHIHGIVIISESFEGTDFLSSPSHQSSPLSGTSKTIGSMVRGFKIGVTKWVRQNTDIHLVWQRNYYERIIRNKSELNGIREYILNNPMKW